MNLKEGLGLCWSQVGQWGWTWLSWKLWVLPLLYEMWMVFFDSEVQKCWALFELVSFVCPGVYVWSGCVPALVDSSSDLWGSPWLHHEGPASLQTSFHHLSCTHTRIKSKPKLFNKILRLNVRILPVRSRSSGGAGRLVLFYDVLDVVTGVHVFCIRRTGLHHIPRRGATCETCDFTFNQMTFMQPCYICLYHLTVITKLILYQSLQNCGG